MKKVTQKLVTLLYPPCGFPEDTPLAGPYRGERGGSRRMWLWSMQYSQGPTPCPLAVFQRISPWQVPIEGRRGAPAIIVLLCCAMMPWLDSFSLPLLLPLPCCYSVQLCHSFGLPPLLPSPCCYAVPLCRSFGLPLLLLLPCCYAVPLCRSFGVPLLLLLPCYYAVP